MLGFKGSISAPDGAIRKYEAHALQCATTGPYNTIPTVFFRAGYVCGLVCDQCRIRINSLAARDRTAANSGTLVKSLAKISAAREYDRAPICALTPE